MSVWERLSGDDAAFLALLWLAICGGAGILYVWAMKRWEQYVRSFANRRRYVLDREPDERIHRPGSVHDFRGQMTRSRWP